MGARRALAMSSVHGHGRECSHGRTRSRSRNRCSRSCSRRHSRRVRCVPLESMLSLPPSPLSRATQKPPLDPMPGRWLKQPPLPAKLDLRQPQPPQVDQQGTPNKLRTCDRYGFQGKHDLNQNRIEYGKATGSSTLFPVWPLSPRPPASFDRAKPPQPAPQRSEPSKPGPAKPEPRPWDRYGIQGKFNYTKNRKEYGKAKGDCEPQLRPLRTPSPVRHASSRLAAAIDGAHTASTPVPAPTTPPALLNPSSAAASAAATPLPGAVPAPVPTPDLAMLVSEAIALAFSGPAPAMLPVRASAMVQSP